MEGICDMRIDPSRPFGDFSQPIIYVDPAHIGTAVYPSTDWPQREDIERAAARIRGQIGGQEIESDPTGKCAHEPGAKLDAGKQLAGVLLDFAHALGAVADVGSMGARKYSRGGWKQVDDAVQRYTDAYMRHLLAYGRGEEIDEQSGMPHLAHAAWNMLAILEFQGRAAKQEKTAHA